MTQSAQIWLCPERLFDGESLRSGMAVSARNGTVQAFSPISDLPADARRLAVPGVLTPGFLDLQVNGGGNALLNNDPSAQAMRVMAAAHRRFGTVAILPTVITDAPEVMARAVEAAVTVAGDPNILGLHIEGPHISLPRRGTHAARFIRPLDDVTIGHVERLRAAGVAVKITLAPEAVQKGQIARLAATGAIVSLGHTDTDSAIVASALAEGARCFTHLYNAMSPMLNRAPGVTGAAINSTAHCGFICDGHHVADAMLALAIRARPIADRMFLVSDAMATVGGSDRFRLYDQEVRLVDGRLVNAEGSLAGAHVTMAESLSRLIRVVGVDPQVALRMAVTVPAGLIGASDMAGLVGRRLEDLLILGPDWMPLSTCSERLGPLAA